MAVLPTDPASACAPTTETLLSADSAACCCSLSPPAIHCCYAVCSALPATRCPTVHRTAADLHRKLLRALPALRQPVELEIMLFVSGLLQVGSMLLELLSEALDTPPPGCQPPPDQLCLAAGAWTAALLGPATAMLRRRDDMSTPLALAGSARPVKLLLTRLEMSAGKPFAAALRRGAARPQLVAATLHELIGAAGYVHELRGGWGWVGGWVGGW